MGRNNTEHELTHIMHKKVYTGQLEEFYFILFFLNRSRLYIQILLVSSWNLNKNQDVMIF